MSKFLSFILFLITLGCTNSQQKKESEKELEGFKFDRAIIDKLPFYDSLRQLIINNYDSFSIGGAFNDFTYIHYFDSLTRPPAELPSTIHSKASQLFDKIGNGNIEGFTLSKDSSIKFSIRDSSNGADHDYWNLYWYPDPNMIKKANKKKKSFSPQSIFKDTILNMDWEYEIELFRKRGLFD